MAQTYRVHVTKGGYGTPPYNLPNIYDFKADSIRWTSLTSIEVAYGTAVWPIINVDKLDVRLTDSWFPCMPPEDLAQQLRHKELLGKVAHLMFENDQLRHRNDKLTKKLEALKELLNKG